jgi:hypothetical protein
MHRSSESIAALAAALAKAQSELINPEKSLVGTIKANVGEGPERSFRYASLSSGLDIVRKTLGQHEIATVQTTAIDHTAGTINLITMLAHASGQWIASDWPVCTIADTAEPHRMGAALTYARRYALFTLVGIAGEDDLDAPDLIAPACQATGHSGNRTGQGTNRGSNGLATQLSARRSGHSARVVSRPILALEQSVLLRDQLLAELDQLASSDATAAWAKRGLRAKNSLTAADAQRVEIAFQVKLAALRGQGAPGAPVSTPIDKSELTFPEPRRVRDKDHIKFVAKQPCLICDRRPSDSHHLRFAQHSALGRKVSDEFTVPLCRGHHRELHRSGNEIAWWKKAGIDPMLQARMFWLKTHPLPTVLDNADNARARPGVAIDANRKEGKPRRSRSKRSASYEAKPIIAAETK